MSYSELRWGGIKDTCQIFSEEPVDSEIEMKHQLLIREIVCVSVRLHHLITHVCILLHTPNPNLTETITSKPPSNISLPLLSAKLSAHVGLWAESEKWEVSPLFFSSLNPWLSSNSYPQLPARLYSFHLTVPFGWHYSVPKWLYIGAGWGGVHSGALFSRWLTLKKLTS